MMGASTFLLYTKATGHVLAAATLAAQKEDVKPEALGGKLLPVHHTGDPAAAISPTAVMVPSAELAVLSVDAEVVSIRQARAVFIKDKTPVPLDFSKTTSMPVHGSTGLTINFTSLSTDKTTVWVRVEPINVPGIDPPSAPQMMSKDVTPTAANMTVTVPFVLQSLPPGQYGALALVPGYVPFLTNFTV